jgi:hypothetical protein
MTVVFQSVNSDSLACDLNRMLRGMILMTSSIMTYSPFGGPWLCM